MGIDESKVGVFEASFAEGQKKYLEFVDQLAEVVIKGILAEAKRGLFSIDTGRDRLMLWHGISNITEGLARNTLEHIGGLENRDVLYFSPAYKPIENVAAGILARKYLTQDISAALFASLFAPRITQKGGDDE